MKKYATRLLPALCLLLFLLAACGSSATSGSTNQSASTQGKVPKKRHSSIDCFTRNSTHIDGVYDSDFDYAQLDSCGNTITLFGRGDHDFDQVIYSFTGSSEGHFSFQGGVTTISNIQFHTIYTIKVESCTHHPFGSSCSGWDTVSLATYFPGECYPGYVWRGAFASDHVCVTPATRDQTAYDNSQASNRVDSNGAYGPDTCLQGFVWRGVVDSDHVCVTPNTRDQVVYDNAHNDEHTYN